MFTEKNEAVFGGAGIRPRFGSVCAGARQRAVRPCLRFGLPAT